MQACDKMPLVQRLSVDDPDALRNEPWRSHLTACQDCRHEFEGHERSLALYRALEAERLARTPAAPSWERFAGRLQARTMMDRRMRTMRVPMAAAVAGLVLLAGALSWSLLAGHPGQQQLMHPLGEQSVAVPVVVESTLFNRTPSAAKRFLLQAPIDPATLAVDDRSAPRVERRVRYARRSTQFPWVDMRVALDDDLMIRPFMGRRNDPGDLAPLTPLHTGGSTGINFASYASAQGR